MLAYRGHQRFLLLQSQRSFFGLEEISQKFLFTPSTSPTWSTWSQGGLFRLEEGLLKGAQVVLGQEGRRGTGHRRRAARCPESITSLENTDIK